MKLVNLPYGLDKYIVLLFLLNPKQEQIYSVGNGSLTSQQPNEPHQPQLL